MYGSLEVGTQDKTVIPSYEKAMLRNMHLESIIELRLERVAVSLGHSVWRRGTKTSQGARERCFNREK